jgi:hypothetical protein
MIQCKTKVPEAGGQFDRPLSEIESRVDEDKRVLGRQPQPVLQPPMAASGLGNQDIRRDIHFSRLSHEATAGSAHSIEGQA